MIRALFATFALVVLSSPAFAQQNKTICSDGFRTVNLLEHNGSVELNGFDVVGVPTGSRFACRGRSLGVTLNLVCATSKDSSFNVYVTRSGAVMSAQLYNPLNVLVFSGLCR